MEYKLKQHIQCKAIRIVSFGVFMYCPNGSEMLCHISNIANEFVSDISKYVTVGEIYDAEVVLDKSGKLSLSLKHLALKDNSKEERNQMNKQSKKKPMKSKSVAIIEEDDRPEIDKLIDSWKKDYKSNVGIGDPRQLGQKSKRRRKGSKR